MKTTKSEKPSNKSGRQSRKQLRKAKRLDKKAKRSEYYHSRNKSVNSRDVEVNHAKTQPSKSRANVVSNNRSVSMVGVVEKEKRAAKQVKAEMKKQRGKQLIDANFEEDKHIRYLEKQLKLNKQKSKTVPKTFAADGLDYLLEVCDSEHRKDIIGKEIDMDDGNFDFDEDFNLMLGKDNGIIRKQREQNEGEANDDEEEEEEEEGGEDDDEDFESASVFSGDSVLGEELGEQLESKQPKQPDPHTWQDIYGRFRDSDGNVIRDDLQESDGKYVPPAARALEGCDSDSTRLRRRLKGLINRLAESNMRSIASEIEALYASNSRHDMNATLASMLFENIVASTTCPERLLLEHALLVAILHANIGAEVGAFFLQRAVQKYCALEESASAIEDKRLDNVVTFIAQLYNFQLFNSQLLHEVLAKLAAKFEEKHVECILNVLRSVGFTLRKDDPIALKALIQCLQAKAAADLSHDNPRVQFMLEVLLAIKNNNFNKIPNYDTSYSEHLKKISKTFIRKGNYATPLRISFDDLLKAEEQGKWWVVGSAWAGKREANQLDDDATDAGKPRDAFSRKFIELAKKQHMNTETRRNIFCIIVSAEDYMDAFEKLLHLGLKSQQEREIVNVLLHCCLSERVYNPYYAVLAQQFCDYDRKFQMIIKYSIWDKLQALADCSPTQIAHLAKLLTHLFLEMGLPISTLKSVQFGELDKVTLRFVRQILLGIMLTPNAERCQEVFTKVSLSANLKLFRESLRLFIHHFLLRNLHKEGASQLDEGQKALLAERAKMLDKLLTANRKNGQQT